MIDHNDDLQMIDNIISLLAQRLMVIIEAQKKIRTTCFYYPFLLEKGRKVEDTPYVHLYTFFFLSIINVEFDDHLSSIEANPRALSLSLSPY